MIAERQADEPFENPGDLSLCPGSRPLFPSEKVAEEFGSEQVRFELRVILIVCDMIYREFGAERMRVLKVLGKEPIYADGRAADVSTLEIPGMDTAKNPSMHPTPAWICKRMNLLFPSSDGLHEVATLAADRILLRVPAGGFPRFTCALGEWSIWGATGRILRPFKVKV